jgi:hypothetical protein
MHVDLYRSKHKTHDIRLIASYISVQLVPYLKIDLGLGAP